MRPTWHHYFTLLAKLVATRSTCNSRPVGCVLVRDKRILCTGYNGALSGVDHCTDSGPGYCYRRASGADNAAKANFCRANHAEANAVAQAASQSISLDGSTAYCTLSPCPTCLRLLVASGVRTVMYETRYDSHDDAWHREALASGIDSLAQVQVPTEVVERLMLMLALPTSTRRLAATE